MSAEFSASTHSAVGAPYDAAAAPTQSSVRDWRSWATFGSGVGIDCLGDDLLVTALNVRFGRVTMFGERRLRGISSRPAADWGAEYASFLKEFDLGHLAAHVVLPSEAVTVRVLSLPPLGAKELEAAVAFQIDSLHPYSESDDVSFAWSKLGRPGSVLVAIARRDVIRNYSTLFAEAGIALASVSVAAAAIHASLRLLAKPASTGFVALDEDEAGLEFYGESDSRAVLSFHTGSGGPRTESYVRAELRLPVDQPLEPLRDLLPAPHKKGEGSELTALAKLPYGSVRSYCAALTAACPLLSHPLNLLPKEQRRIEFAFDLFADGLRGFAVARGRCRLCGAEFVAAKGLSEDVERRDPQAGARGPALEIARQRHGGRDLTHSSGGCFPQPFKSGSGCAERAFEGSTTTHLSGQSRGEKK